MKIYKARTTWTDSLPELLSMWEEKGWCEVIQSEEKCTWAKELGDILLYEHDRLTHLPVDWNFGLFSNEIHQGEKSTPWIYWPRHPRKLEACIIEGILNYDQKDIESIFLGKVENPIQYRKRSTHDWSNCVEVFSMPVELGVSGNHRLSNEEYLKTIKRARFGLCLSGHGPKCQREIELMGLGVVPVFTKGVDTQYFEPLQEGVHYLYAESPEKVKEVINGCSKNQWKSLQVNCLDWYFRNCSREGSFETTEFIINRNELENG
tara:strand:- start:6322 stop:7110 length:789 start_codon:yes stop_codon:yes gene_type:complete